jgi:hypothetical protein
LSLFMVILITFFNARVLSIGDLSTLKNID